jgi:hypothetical protein
VNILIVFKYLSVLLSVFFNTEGSILIESIESKTDDKQAIFNKISFQQINNQDIWKMKQSHGGFHSKDWDEVKIIVDKSSFPFSASYHQLKDGVEIEYRTSCFRCHSGGPRFIRPNYESNQASLSIKEKAIILKWNLLIKSYGEVKVKENSPFKRKIKLIKNTELAHKVLKLESCKDCHFDGGPRSKLTMSNLQTAKFLIKSKAMPPWPYSLNKKDLNIINEFIYGF